jgi:hypothetical protein
LCIGKPFYISEGLGQTGVNIRVGSRPEITLPELTLGTDNQEAKQLYAEDAAKQNANYY